MQIMPTTYNDFNITQTSFTLAGQDFSQSMNDVMNTYSQSDYNNSSEQSRIDDEKAREEREEERRRNMRSESESFDINDHLDSPYTDSANSKFVVEPARLIPSELESLAQNLMNDGASIDAINTVKAMQNKVGGVTADQVAGAVEDVMRGTKNNLTAEETTTLQNFCNRISPSDPDTLYNNIRYASGKKGVEAVENAFGEMQGTRMASLSQDEISAIGRALNLSQGTIAGLEEKLKDLNTSGANYTMLSQKQVEELLGSAEAEIQTQAITQEKTMASLEGHLADAEKTAETREAAALAAQSRESKETVQKRMIMEDTATTRALGDSMNNKTRAGEEEELSSNAKLQLAKEQNAKEEAFINTRQEETRFVQTERDSLASTIESASTVRKTLETNDNHFAKAEQEVELNNTTFANEQNSKFNNLSGNERDVNSVANASNSAFVNNADFGNGNNGNNNAGNNGFESGRDARNPSSSHSFGETTKFEYAFASASQSHYSTIGATSTFSSSSTNINSITGIDNALNRNTTADLAPDVRSQVQNSITKSMMGMSGDGTKSIELDLNPIELGQLNLALSIKNGEVNATIRAEKAETAAVINAQMDAIRQELENQGFKVEKVEVEVGLSQDNFADTRQDWQGAEYHNSTQQQFEQLQFIEQLQILNKLSAIDRGERIPLARNMQDKGIVESQTANSALTGMHITV